MSSDDRDPGDEDDGRETFTLTVPAPRDITVEELRRRFGIPAQEIHVHHCIDSETLMRQIESGPRFRRPLR